MTKIKVAMSTIAMYYRITTDNQNTYIFFASPLEDVIAEEVLLRHSEEYTLLWLVNHVSIPHYFLRGVNTSEEFVSSTTGLEGEALSLFTYLVPHLTKLSPADDIIAEVEKWQTLNNS